MIRRPPRSTLSSSSAASDVYKRQDATGPKPAPSRASVRNSHWRHLNSMRILPVPDRWEYPWFAAWDLAFTCVPLALVDPQFAKESLSHLLFEQFQHPNGQIPAYEWEFSDLNPPVHAWAVSYTHLRAHETASYIVCRLLL